MEQLGRTLCVYDDGQNDTVTLTAIVGPERTAEEETDSGKRVRRSCSATIGTDPSSPDGGVADPKRSATLTIGGALWAIEEVEALTSSMARLSLVLLPVTELTRPGLKGA